MNESTAPAAGAESGTARDEGLPNVAAAVAELERRDAARREERRAKQDASEGADADADDGDADDEPADKRKTADKSGKTDKPKTVASDDDADDDGEADEDSDEDADAEAADEDATDDDDGDEKPKAAKPPAEAQPAQPQRIKLRLNDRDVEATPDEVAEYVREATTQRQQVETHRQQIAQQAQALQQQGQALAQLAQSLLGQEPDLMLAQTDPGAYIAQQAQFRQRQSLLQQLQGHTTQASQIAQAQQQQAFSATVERERQALLKAMPELADPAKLSAFSGRIAKVAQRYGLTAQELQGAYDHRSYLMLHDLCRLADMEAERANVRKKLKGAPPLQQPEQRASTGQRNTADLAAKDAKRAFLKSGRSMRDVRDYLDRTER